MRNLMLMVGAAVIALAAPLAAQGRGEGKGGGHGPGHGAEQRDRGEGKGEAGNRGGGRERGERGQRAGRPDRGPPDKGARAERGNRGQEARAERGNRGRGDADNRERRAGRDDARDRGPARAEARGERRLEREVRRGERRAERRIERRAERRIERRAVRVANPAAIVRLRHAPNRGFVRGCPPGLARQNAACLPPGQLRRLQAERNRYAAWWPRYRDDDYRYWNGSLYRLEPTGIVVGFVPLAGGALWLNNVWPADYAYDPVPDYYLDYYGWDDPYDYRYADGLVYGLDPETQMIQQLVGLLAGDDWGIGSAMPAGYDVYNVPYAYRDQYYDTPDDWYRYSDGYIYQVDPTTQLVEAAIQLLV